MNQNLIEESLREDDKNGTYSATKASITAFATKYWKNRQNSRTASNDSSQLDNFPDENQLIDQTSLAEKFDSRGLFEPEREDWGGESLINEQRMQIAASLQSPSPLTSKTAHEQAATPLSKKDFNPDPISMPLPPTQNLFQVSPGISQLASPTTSKASQAYSKSPSVEHSAMGSSQLGRSFPSQFGASVAIRDSQDLLASVARAYVPDNSRTGSPSQQFFARSPNSHSNLSSPNVGATTPFISRPPQTRSPYTWVSPKVSTDAAKSPVPAASPNNPSIHSPQSFSGRSPSISIQNPPATPSTQPFVGQFSNNQPSSTPTRPFAGRSPSLKLPSTPPQDPFAGNLALKSDQGLAHMMPGLSVSVDVNNGSRNISFPPRNLHSTNLPRTSPVRPATYVTPHPTAYTPPRPATATGGQRAVYTPAVNVAPVSKVLAQPTGRCNCSRPQKLILCRTCGGTMTGRVRIKCPEHPGSIFLMDQQCCVSCQSTSLVEVCDSQTNANAHNTNTNPSAEGKVSGGHNDTETWY